LNPELTVLQEVPRLPVYDDDGEPIPFDLIQERVDPSGLGGAFGGGLAGGVAGLIVGLIHQSLLNCDGSDLDDSEPCSPREHAMRDRLNVLLPVTFGTIGAWLGRNRDITTWQEAVAEIREERRLGAPR
jgi:hypothetical protein